MISLKAPQQEVDWTKHHIEGRDLRPTIVTNKFALWDYVIKHNLLEHEDELIRSQAVLLLDDPTIYEYAFFKNEQDEQFRYEAYQDLIAQCRYDFKDEFDPNRFILFVASNQIGKSRLEIGLARKFLFNSKGENIVIVTNNLKLTQFILSELKANLNTGAFANSWKEDIDDTNNTTMLTVKITIDGKEYLNRLICTPAGEGSLGYPIHRLFLDELDFYEDGKRIFWKVFYPRLNKTKGQCFCLSNPNPDIPLSTSILKQLWDGDLFKRKFHFNYLDASWNTIEGFEEARRNSPSNIFASTHLGEWSEDSGSFFTQKQLDDMFKRDWKNHKYPAVADKVYVGMDLGKMRDNTVISIGVAKNPLDARDKFKDLDVVYMEELPLGTTYEAIVDKYIEIKTYYEENYRGVAEMGYDATGQKTFMDILKMKGVHGTGVDFSKKESQKTTLYNDFLMMVENRKMRVVYNHKCEYQLANLEFKKTESKKYKKVENKTDSIHDDWADSLAVLIHIAVKPSRVPPSATYVKHVKEEDKEEQITTTYDDAKDYYAQVVMENNSFNKPNYGGGFKW